MVENLRFSSQIIIQKYGRRLKLMEIFTKDSYKEYLKKNIQGKTNAEFTRIASELETEAEIRMGGPLYSVTFGKSRAKRFGIS